MRKIGETSPTLKDFGKIIFYLVATVILGALLAPPLFWGAHWLAGHGILTSLTDYEFRKFFNRAVLGSALILLWPVARWINVPRVRDLGIRPNPRRWSDLGIGFLAAFLVMAVYAVILVSLKIYKVRGEIQWYKIGEAVPPTLVVPFLEEWLFRGAILGLLLRGLRPYVALFFVSALFSALHFLKPEEAATAAASVHWLSGFALIPGTFAQFGDLNKILAGLVTLFCIGWVLGWTRLKTASLWIAIGLHAGWIFGLKSFSAITRRSNKADFTPWLGENLIVGLCSAAMVLLTGLLVWFWVTRLRAKDEPLLDTAKNG